jgi:ubiquitin C-terminal hydrolase
MRIRTQNTTIRPKYLIVNNNLTKTNIKMNFEETMNNYHMKSVIFHDGGLNSGHYFGGVLRSDHWWVVDDETSIQLNSFSEIQSKTPYVFMYVLMT